MTDDMQVTIDDAVAIAILQSPEVQAELLRRAQQIAAAAGDGTYDVTASLTPTRARVSVATGDHAARVNEATNRGLTSALDAGRE